MPISDTTTKPNPDRAVAHYAQPVTDDLTPEQVAAIDTIRAASVALRDAREVEAKAKIARITAIRDAWPIIGALGPTRIAQIVGDDLVGEGTLRGATPDLRAAAAARAQHGAPA